MSKRIRRVCKCGCKELVKPKKEFIRGHNSRGVNHHNYGKHKEDNVCYKQERSAETKEKMRIARIGRTLSEEHKANIGNSIRGEKHGNFGKRGPLSHLWRGGISTGEYCISWADPVFKEYIKERDNHECQSPLCRKNCNHLPLELHHINYIKKDCSTGNLITVCCSCNSRANHNRKFWQKYYEDIMNKN